MKIIIPYITLSVFLTINTGLKPQTGEDTELKKVLVISVDGSINPSSAEYISSGMTSITNLCPILVFVYSVFYLKESVTRDKVVGFLVVALIKRSDRRIESNTPV